MSDSVFVSRMHTLNFIAISGWAGTGKSTAAKNEELLKHFSIIDLDSSIVREKYNKNKHMLSFQAFYVQQIIIRAKRALIEDKSKFPIVLISAHQDVIRSVIAHRIPLIIVYLNKGFRYEYLYNLYKRIPNVPVEEMINLPQFRAWKYSIDHIDEMYNQLSEYTSYMIKEYNIPVLMDELTNERYISDTIYYLYDTYFKNK